METVEGHLWGEDLLGKALEETVRVPARALGPVGHRLRQRPQQVVEASGALQIHGLLQVVGRRVVALLQPGLRNLLLGRSLVVAYLHGQRGDTAADKAVLVAADENV